MSLHASVKFITLVNRTMSSDDMLDYYQFELDYLRKLVHEYAEHYPKLAQRLKLEAKSSSADVQIERLIQSAAWLNARSLNAINDEFSELSHGILAIKAPHFIAPIPSCSIVQFQARREYLEKKISIPGKSILASHDQQSSIHVQTIYPVEIMPIEVDNVQIFSHPSNLSFDAVSWDAGSQIRSILSIRLKMFRPNQMWHTLAMDKLVFHINARAPDNYHLYDLLMHKVQGIALANGINDRFPVMLEKKSLQPMGFTAEESLLDYRDQIKWGYKILNDYAIFPEKFLFFSVTNLEEILLTKKMTSGNDLELLFFLSEDAVHLSSRLKKEFFALNCTPVVNIFPEKASITGENQWSPELNLSRLIPNKDHDHEVYSLDKVVGYCQDGIPREFLDYQSHQHVLSPQLYYYAQRVPAHKAGYYQANKSELILSFVNEKKERQAMQGWTFELEMQCSNGDLPSQINWMTCTFDLMDQRQEAVAKIVPLRKFTQSFHPFMNRNSCWQFISHLRANPLAIHSEQAINAFSSILKLYDYDPKQPSMSQGLLDIKYRPQIKHHPNANQGAPPFWHGAEISLHLAAKECAHKSLYLFAAIMAEFIPTFVSRDFFAQLKIEVETGEIYYWPERRGQL